MVDMLHGTGGYVGDDFRAQIQKSHLNDKFELLKIYFENKVNHCNNEINSLEQKISEMYNFNFWYFYYCPLKTKIYLFFKKDKKKYLDNKYEEWKHNNKFDC